MSGYSLAAYGKMADDPVRMGAYVEAMRRNIKAGDVVLDLGTGPGVMALLACQFGASRVYAIETSSSIEIAKLAAARNGYADRIHFFRRPSTEVIIPEQVDVLVSDLRGQSPLHQGHIPSIIDARERFLRPGGVQIGWRDRLMVGLSCDPVAYRGVRRPWLENDYGLDLRDGFSPVLNSIYRNAPLTNRSLGRGKVWAELDYTTISSADVKGSAMLEVAAGDEVNGLELWFEAELCEGVCYNTGPDQPEQVYGRSWLPLERPVLAADAGCLEVSLSMNFVDGDYVIGWNTALYRNGSTQALWQSRQSTFHNLVSNPVKRQLLNPRLEPVSTQRAQALAWLLAKFGSGIGVVDLADLLQREFPSVFLGNAQASAFVRAAVANFGLELDASPVGS